MGLVVGMARNPADPRIPERYVRVQTWIFEKNIDAGMAKFRGFHTGQPGKSRAAFVLKWLLQAEDTYANSLIENLLKPKVVYVKAGIPPFGCI